jgi:hypothetical protein
MTRPRRHRTFTPKLLEMAATLVTLAMAIGANAAVSNGPKYTNAVAAEEQRIFQFYQAQQSFQEQLKVGRERYEQKQINRAKVIAAMSAELQAREQTVVISPASASDGNTEGPISGFGPWLAVTSLALGLGSLGCYLNRQRPQEAFVRKRRA